MAIVVSHRIRAREFGKAIPAQVLPVLIRMASVALATPLAGRELPAGNRLLKAYAASSDGPRRIVYMLQVETGDLFLLFYRDKNDPIGANISNQNPAFRIQLRKHLALLLEDINRNQVEVIDLNAGQ